ncbi:uncharacterized protein LOC132741200 [Ruditapes philippinarum]|uniref:uncharacterized protein LOC132741200 n=1 Tax=Ruditapes philippinarum TaxID=129788 RepID=UPI00295BEF4F|nr:uncharacterized protein LOC132741200 [Ruditapes philippinarum]
MGKLLIILFLFINVAHWAKGIETQISEKRFVVEVGVSVCVDKIPNCAAYTVTICLEIQFRLWAVDVCAKFCNFCTISASPGPVTRSSGTRNIGPASLESFDGLPGCFYKNQIYQEGASWNDGCNYSCRCLDGMSRLYHCKSSICTAVNTEALSHGSSSSGKIFLHDILARKN